MKIIFRYFFYPLHVRRKLKRGMDMIEAEIRAAKRQRTVSSGLLYRSD